MTSLHVICGPLPIKNPGFAYDLVSIWFQVHELCSVSSFSKDLQLLHFLLASSSFSLFGI